MLETINLLALTLPLVASGAAYTTLRKKAVSRVLAALIAVGVPVMVLSGYWFTYRYFGFPPWMRWLVYSYDSEPLPGRPEVDVNTKLDADWTIVGMNYDWMVLVAKPYLQIGSFSEAYIRWEFAKPQESDGGKVYLSQVLWVELECKKGSWNSLFITSYAANNLSGAEVDNVSGDREHPLWETPEPTSILGAAVRTACQLFEK